MDKTIFKDFLDKKEVYKKNVTFWNTVISGLLSPENIPHDEYIATSDGYGNEFYDGNPIISFKVDKLNKGVRIIQEEHGESSKNFSAWLSECELTNGEKIDELVIDLELTRETVFLTIDLVNAWILNDLTKFRMKRYIQTLSNLTTQVAGLHEPELV